MVEQSMEGQHVLSVMVFSGGIKLILTGDISSAAFLYYSATMFILQIGICSLLLFGKYFCVLDIKLAHIAKNESLQFALNLTCRDFLYIQIEKDKQTKTIGEQVVFHIFAKLDIPTNLCGSKTCWKQVAYMPLEKLLV